MQVINTTDQLVQALSNHESVSFRPPRTTATDEQYPAQDALQTVLCFLTERKWKVTPDFKNPVITLTNTSNGTCNITTETKCDEHSVNISIDFAKPTATRPCQCKTCHLPFAPKTGE